MKHRTEIVFNVGNIKIYHICVEKKFQILAKANRLVFIKNAWHCDALELLRSYES